jgi:hypothetical protein
MRRIIPEAPAHKPRVSLVGGPTGGMPQHSYSHVFQREMVTPTLQQRQQHGSPRPCLRSVLVTRHLIRPRRNNKRGGRSEQKNDSKSTVEVMEKFATILRMWGVCAPTPDTSMDVDTHAISIARPVAVPSRIKKIYDLYTSSSCRRSTTCEYREGANMRYDKTRIPSGKSDLMGHLFGPIPDTFLYKYLFLPVSATVKQMMSIGQSNGIYRLVDR